MTGNARALLTPLKTGCEVSAQGIAVSISANCTQAIFSISISAPPTVLSFFVCLCACFVIGPFFYEQFLVYSQIERKV